MDESRRQFEESFAKWHPDMTRANNGLNYADPILDVCWIAWQASRQAQLTVAYLSCHGDALTPGDFAGGAEEMHETAKREGWRPLSIKGGE